MGQALYRKYRSRSLDEIVGQEHVVTALKTALKSGRVNHAYLFTGPRGVGKTSIARILAHEINDLPYNEETSHIDIIEIDAASNRGIDEIRDLREKVYVAPTSGKYKVYIIDEVHMLTTQAFNALLKTLEEPPAHVIFILATTEIHKLPATIISRTQRYTFRPADDQRLIEHLRSISAQENVKIDDQSLALIAEHGDGSYRDSVSLLDQIIGGKKSVTVKDVHELLGIPPVTAVSELVGYIQRGQLSAIASNLAALHLQGYQAATIAKEIAKLLRSSILEQKPLLTTERSFNLLKQLINVPTSSDPMRYLEIAVLEAAGTDAAAQATTPAPTAPPQVFKETESKPKQVKAEPESSPMPGPAAEISTKKASLNEDMPPTVKLPTKKNSEITQKSTKDNDFDEKVWPQVLTQLKTQYNTLYSIIRMAQIDFGDQKVSLTFNFAFHQKRLNEAKNKTIVANIIKEVCGKDIEIVCLYDKNAKPDSSSVAASATKTPDKSLVDTVSNIFGGGELLES
jgi:DNA polymerase-3 subunit gamma/tau